MMLLNTRVQREHSRAEAGRWKGLIIIPPEAEGARSDALAVSARMGL